jgi:hypothetical protein
MAHVYKLAKVRGWTAFARNASSVSVELDGESISLTPLKNLGSAERYGFVLGPGAVSRVTGNDPAALGAALRATMARSPAAP